MHRYFHILGRVNQTSRLDFSLNIKRNFYFKKLEIFAKYSFFYVKICIFISRVNRCESLTSGELRFVYFNYILRKRVSLPSKSRGNVDWILMSR